MIVGGVGQALAACLGVTDKLYRGNEPKDDILELSALAGDVLTISRKENVLGFEFLEGGFEDVNGISLPGVTVKEAAIRVLTTSDRYSVNGILQAYWQGRTGKDKAGGPQTAVSQVWALCRRLLSL